MTITRSPFAHFCHIPKPARQTRPRCLRTRMLSRPPILTPLVPQATQMSADTHVASWQPKGPASCPIKPQTSPAVWIPLCKIPFCPDVHYLFYGRPIPEANTCNRSGDIHLYHYNHPALHFNRNTCGALEVVWGFQVPGTLF